MNNQYDNSSDFWIASVMMLFVAFYMFMVFYGYRYIFLFIAILSGKKEFLNEDDLCPLSKQKRIAEWRERQKRWSENNDGKWNKDDILK